jgi:hypothetical protein
MGAGRVEPGVTAEQRIHRGKGMRALRRIVFAGVVVLVAVFLLVQFQQHLLRHRAERLHGEIVALQLHPGDVCGHFATAT